MKRISMLFSAAVLIVLVATACQAPQLTAPVSPLNEPGAETSPTPDPNPATPRPLDSPIDPPGTPRASRPLRSGAAISLSIPSLVPLPNLRGRLVTAVTANDYPPLNFINPLHKQPEGLEYDLAEEICRRLNCRIEWKTASWEALLTEVQADRYDIGLDGLIATQERRQQGLFSEPYLALEYTLLVRSEEDRFTVLQSFRADPQLKLGAVAGTTGIYIGAYEVLNVNETSPRLRRYPNANTAIQALVAGDVDMVVLDEVASREYLAANRDQLQLFGEPLERQEFRIAFPPHSDLVTAFNSALAQMKADGTLEYLNRRWFFFSDPNGEDAYEQLPDLKAQRIVVISPADYPPLGFSRSGEKSLTGWEAEAIEEICHRLNCQIEWQPVPRDNLLTALNAGQADAGIGGILVTPARQQQVEFSTPLLTLQPSLLVRFDEVRFTTPQEFRASPDLLVGARQGSVNFYAAAYELLQEKETSPRLQRFATLRAAVRALATGEIDLVLLDSPAGQRYVAANPRQFRLLKASLELEAVGIAFPPQSELIDPFNAALKTMADDGFLAHLDTRWFFLYDPAGR